MITDRRERGDLRRNRKDADTMKFHFLLIGEKVLIRTTEVIAVLIEKP